MAIFGISENEVSELAKDIYSKIQALNDRQNADLKMIGDRLIAIESKINDKSNGEFDELSLGISQLEERNENIEDSIKGILSIIKQIKYESPMQQPVSVVVPPTPIEKKLEEITDKINKESSGVEKSMYTANCLRCGESVPVDNPIKGKTKGGNTYIKGKCSKCGMVVCKFVKNSIL